MLDDDSGLLEDLKKERMKLFGELKQISLRQ